MDWDRESGWDRLAESPSEAHGIPGPLPPPRTTAPENIRQAIHKANADMDWGINYIRDRHGFSQEVQT